MKVIFLGIPERSILIDESLLLDCGEGTTRKLIQINAIDNLKSIFLTHLHVDHFLGIFMLLWYYMVRGRKNDLTIYGPSKTKETIEKILTIQIKVINPNFQGDFNTLRFKLHFIELIESDEIQEIQDEYKIKYVAMEHGIPTLAYRVEDEEKSICYSGDTRPNSKLIKLAKKCNIFICESNFPDKLPKGEENLSHCTASDTAKMAGDADCEKLVLVHIDPRYKEEFHKNIDEMHKIFTKEILVAHDFMTLEILP